MRASLPCTLVTVVVVFSNAAAAQPAPIASAAAPSPSAPPYYELYPDHLPYSTSEPVPAGYVVEKDSTGTWGIVTGSIVLGVFYTYGLLAMKGGKGANWLFLPVVGPSGLLLTDSRHCKPRCHGLEQGTLIVDAVGQAGAAAFFIWGLTSWRQRLVREDLAKPRSLVVTPMVLGSGYGVGALGSF
jgi:hypothetical protein